MFVAMKKRTYLPIILILVATQLLASEFRYLQPSDGLVSGEINHIAQDNTGQIWIATWSGLICYNGYGFRNYRPLIGDKNSMPDKKVKLLHIDSNGHLWVATERNLVRMNIHSHIFETFRFNRDRNTPVNILNLNEISGNIIIHTVEGFYYVPINQENHDHYLISKLEVIYENSIQHVYFHETTQIDKERMIGASNTSENNGSNIYILQFREINGNKKLISKYVGNINTSVLSLKASDNNNEIYIGTNKGLYISEYEQNNFSANILFEGNRINHILSAANNVLYAAGISPEIFYYNKTSGTEGSFVARAGKEGSLLNSNINTLFEDFSGVLWIGHQGQGISLLNLFHKEFHTIRYDPLINGSLSSNAIMCMESSKHYLLVGCRTGGINIAPVNSIGKQKNVFENVSFSDANSDITSNGIWDICRQNDSLFWVAHSKGLMKLTLEKNGNWNMERYGNNNNTYIGSLRYVYIDEHSNLWCGTQNDGLLFFRNPNKNNEKNYHRFSYEKNKQNSLSDNVVQHIMQDKIGNLWIGTGRGLNVLDKRDFEKIVINNDFSDIAFKRYISTEITDSTLASNEINMIFEHPNGNLWVATQGGGVNIYDYKSGRFGHLSEKIELPGNDILGIVADNNNSIWISTEKGLVEYNEQDDKMPITVYNQSDGIQSDVFLINSYHKTTDCKLFFGGENGFTAFFPDDIKINTIKPKIHITDFIVFPDTHESKPDEFWNNYGKDLHENKSISLSNKNNTIGIGLTAIHYQYPQGNKIAYKLEGYQDDWNEIDASSRYVNYTKLPAGDYTFKAYALSTDNISSEEIKSIQIKILPPWYKSNLATVVFIIVGLLITGLGALVASNRQKQLYLRRLYDIRIENNESKMTFLANIAHELRTPINLIISPIEDLLRNIDELNQKWHNHMFLIHRNSNYILKLINQIIDFRKLDAGKLKLNKKNIDIVALVKDVALNFKAFESKNSVELKLNIPFDSLNINIDPQKIEEVLYNLLSNAFKHTPREHIIEVSVNIEQESETELGNLKIIVFNEGSHVPKDECKKIFDRFYKINESDDGAGIGLSFAKSLIEMHNGEIWVESDENKGVLFLFTIPLIVVDEEIDPASEEEKAFTNAIESKALPYNSIPKDSIKEIGTKVLIVEDNSDLRNFMSEILSRFYDCYVAADGEEGLKMVNDIIPDIIITDAIMPRMDGNAMVKKVKEDIKTCHIPVIMLTARNENENLIEGYDAGVDAYIVKPVNTNVVLSQISRLIKNRRLIHEKYKQQNFMVEVSGQTMNRDDVFMKKVRKILDKHIDNPVFNVKEFSEELQMSTTQLYRKIKSLTGHSPVEFLRITRLHKAHDLLAEKNYSIKEVSYLTGFNNLSYFVKCFREYFGVTPANYRDKTWTG
jgi:signal transduction histidine kinase/ligand-binding sensor domain-containing protein/DNA-binding response OmpR family regulator